MAGTAPASGHVITSDDCYAPLAAGTTLTRRGADGVPEDAAGAVCMFCIPESDYVTGETLICGGGFTL